MTHTKSTIGLAKIGFGPNWLGQNHDGQNHDGQNGIGESRSCDVVPLKGGDTEWVSEQVCRNLRKFGISGDVVFKTDQEPALVDLMKRFAPSGPQADLV